MLRALFHEESGQDLAEYCLITAFLALIALGVLYRLSGGLQGLWGTANSALTNGNTAAGTTGTTQVGP